MAASNLFPPIIDTYLPAFTIDSDGNGLFKIIFELSPFNIEDDILDIVLVSIRDLYNNLNLLKSNTEILFSKFTPEDNGKYSISIEVDDLQDKFHINSFYKILLRFMSAIIELQELKPIKNEIQWINEHLEYFSEWSTVCLIKAISEPVINITPSNPNGNIIIINLQFNTIYGSVSFLNKSDNETLKSYRIILKETNSLGDIIYEDSGDLYFEQSKFSFSYKLKYLLLKNKIYTIYIDILTKNLYSLFKEVKIQYEPIKDDTKYFGPDPILVFPQSEVGRNKIVVTFNSEEIENFNANLIIKRTSNKDNFTYWEDVHITHLIAARGSTYTWYDYTIESGTWYKYAILVYKNKYSSSIINELPVINIFDDIFLNCNGLQLKIKYDPQVNSLSRVVMDSKIETIGSKYPFFSRNSLTNYRTFPIGGLISFISDETDDLEEDDTQNNLFTSKKKVYGNLYSLYEAYNLNNNINKYNDILYEREFRELVMDFLYSNNLKLFRSTLEGNILVKLMDISFSPQTTLGRKVYNFSATAYEAGECTVENYNKYNILKIGSIVNEINKVYNRFYYVMGEILDSSYDYSLINTDLVKIILNNQNNNSAKITKFTYLKILFLDEPYLLKNTDNNEALLAVPEDKNTYLGYLININGKNIAVNSDGIYELESEKGYDISSFTVKKGKYIFDYIVQVSVITDKDNANNSLLTASTSSVTPMSIGQLLDSFDSNTDIISIIKNKHGDKNVVSLSIEGDSNVVCYIQTKNKDKDKESSKVRYVLGLTEFLCIEDKDTIIKSCTFSGIRLIKNNFNTALFKQVNNKLKYIYNNIEYDINIYDNNLILNNDITDISKIREIDILKPVEAIVNYKYIL